MKRDELTSPQGPERALGKFGRVPASKAKEWAREHVRGLWAAMMGATTADDEVDEEGIRAGVRRALELEIGGLTYSSLFEIWSSTHEERMRGLEVMLDEVRGRLPIYVNVTDHSMKETVRLGQHALDHGASILLVQCPYEHAKSDEQTEDFLRYVCERLDGAIALYNTAHSGTIMSPELINRLADIANVCAIKNGNFDVAHTGRLFELAGDRIVISNPIESTYLHHIREHGQQAMFSCSAVHLMQTPRWQPIAEYQRYAWAGDFEAAERVHAELEPLRRMWDRAYRSVSSGDGPASHPIALTKYWQELMGVPAGPPRPPLHELSLGQKSLFRKELLLSGLAGRLGIEERLLESL